MNLHVLYNYDQFKKASTRDALAMFIPVASDGGNGQCRMFWERVSGRGGGEPLPTSFQIVRAAA